MVWASLLVTPTPLIADIPITNGFVLFHPPNELEEELEKLPMLSLELEELDDILYSLYWAT